MSISSHAIACGALAALLVTGCGDSKSPGAPSGPTPTSTPLNVSIELAKGQTFTASDQSFALRFEQVTEESRCPAAANCIQMGQAVLAMSAREGTAAFAPLTLSTAEGKQTGQVGRVTVTLERVSPYPYQSFEEIPADAYRAAIRLTRP